MFSKRSFMWVVGMAAALSGVAADRLIPRGYYNAIDGKSEAELKTALFNVINPHTLISSYSNLPQYFQVTDVYPQSSRWWDMYSDIPLYAPSFRGLNREHSFPKSWWGGSTETPAYIDLNHLYPSEAAANMAKSNYPLGTVDRTKPLNFENGVTTVGIAVSGQGGGANLVFEPADEYKGDFARTYFYMVTCYQNLTWKYLFMVDNNTYPTLNNWSRKLLLEWNEQDPVSQKEIDRNEAVYSYQNNRNPFIDFPELAEYIWGDYRGQAFVLSEHLDGNYNPGTPELINPSQGSVLEFGEVALGSTLTARLLVHGENLTQGTSLRLRIYDNAETNGAAHFAIDGSNQGTVSASVANSPQGQWVTVSYTPRELGQHTTRLVISGAGIEGSVGVGLRGECLPVPELSAPVAEAASNVTATSYTANWSSPANEVVDYWVVNRTKYIGSGAETEQLLAEEPSLTITDFCGSESYTVQSVRLGYYSPESNAVSVTSAGISAVETNAQLGISRLPGGLLVTCSEPIAVLRIFAPSGRLIQTVTDVENNSFIELPAGVYIISSPQLAIPLKTIVNNE
ncbi:MAG: ribonuclease [Bacteroides sp.]|nr:ribonuclease [Bacteroides sp.]